MFACRNGHKCVCSIFKKDKNWIIQCTTWWSEKIITLCYLKLVKASAYYSCEILIPSLLMPITNPQTTNNIQFISFPPPRCSIQKLSFSKVKIFQFTYLPSKLLMGGFHCPFSHEWSKSGALGYCLGGPNPQLGVDGRGLPQIHLRWRIKSLTGT